MGGAIKSIGRAVGGAVGGLYKTVTGYAGDPLGTNSIDKGVAAQAEATKNANAFLERQYNQQRSDLEPWRTAGTTALSQMADPDFKRDFKMTDFTADPGYDFRMAEGQKAIERSAAARGGLQSGGTLKAISQYGQDYASNEYGNAYNRFNSDRDRRFGRLSNIAGMGQNAVNRTVSASGNYGDAASSNLTSMGNAYAAGSVAQANAHQQMTGNIMSMFGAKSGMKPPGVG